MRVLSTTILATILVMQSAFANVSNFNSELIRVFNNYKYALTVEWDHKDLSKLESYKLEMNAQLDSLRAQGLTTKELAQFISESINDRSVRAEFNSLVKLAEAGNLNTEASLQAAIEKFSRHVGATTGASFRSSSNIAAGVIGGTLGAAVLAGFVAYFLIGFAVV